MYEQVHKTIIKRSLQKENLRVQLQYFMIAFSKLNLNFEQLIRINVQNYVNMRRNLYHVSFRVKILLKHVLLDNNK